MFPAKFMQGSGWPNQLTFYYGSKNNIGNNQLLQICNTVKLCKDERGYKAGRK